MQTSLKDVLFGPSGGVLPFLGAADLVALVAAAPELDVPVSEYLTRRFGVGPPVPMILMPDDTAHLWAASHWATVTHSTMCAVTMLALPVRLEVWCIPGTLALEQSLLFQTFLDQAESVDLIWPERRGLVFTNASGLLARMQYAATVTLTRCRDRVVIPDTVGNLRLRECSGQLSGCKGVRYLTTDCVPDLEQWPVFENIEVLYVDLREVPCGLEADQDACPLHRLARWARRHPTLQAVHLGVPRDYPPHVCPIATMPGQVDMCIDTDTLPYLRDILWREGYGPYWSSRKRRRVPEGADFIDMCPGAG